MYLPRLRGRQFEISAIRSCAQSFAARGRVVPIIELVKSPDDLLARRLDSISDQGLSCGLVLNPSVGEMKGSTGWQALGTFLLDRNRFRETRIEMFGGISLRIAPSRHPMVYHLGLDP